MNCRITSVGISSALGQNNAETLEGLFNSKSSLQLSSDWMVGGKPTFLGQCKTDILLPKEFAHLASHNNLLAYQAFLQIQPQITQAIHTYGKERIAIVVGSSTSGMSRTEIAYQRKERGESLEGYAYPDNEISNLASTVAQFSGVTGPKYGISTACSSSANAIISGARLLEMGLADAVIVGGVDSLCQMTIQGFSCLELVSSQKNKPFMQGRDGLNIGEAACLLLLEKKEGGVQLKGFGQSTDAHHMSAPDPAGKGAERSIQAALHSSGLQPEDISYINLHGTGTQLNDQAEAMAISRVFGANTPCSSTKAMTGHTLGAAGALECGLCWLVLSEAKNEIKLPPHFTEGKYDPALPEILLVRNQEKVKAEGEVHFLSNSFAFGGNNCSLILSRKFE